KPSNLPSPPNGFAVGIPFALFLGLAALGDLVSPQAARAQTVPAPSENRMDAARDRIDAQRFWEAIPLLRAELNEHPENDDARPPPARVLSWERSYDQSLAEYRQLLGRHPDDPSIRAGYARVLAWSGRHDEAAREFRRAIQADSTNLETRVGYARALSW